MPPTRLDARELAERIGWRPDEILSWARTGRIPSVKTRSGRRWFNLDAVVRALREQAQAAVAEVAS